MENCFPLFGSRVDLDSVAYFIHGLVHDNPLISIPKEFKERINEKLKDYDVICEDGFTEWIPDSESFNEIEYFGLNKISFAQYLASLKNYFHNRFVKKTHKTDLMQKVQEMNSLDDLEKIRESLFSSYPPEPQGMNSILSRFGRGTLDNPVGELPLRIKRYVYEAKTARNYAKGNHLDELHIIVGCAHELPLEYLLKNPDLLKNLSNRV